MNNKIWGIGELSIFIFLSPSLAFNCSFPHWILELSQNWTVLNPRPPRYEHDPCEDAEGGRVLNITFPTEEQLTDREASDEEEGGSFQRIGRNLMALTRKKKASSTFSIPEASKEMEKGMHKKDRLFCSGK